MNWGLLLKEFVLPGNNRDFVNVLINTEGIDEFIANAKDALDSGTPKNKRLFFDRFLKPYPPEKYVQLQGILDDELTERYGQPFFPPEFEENYKKIYEELQGYFRDTLTGQAGRMADNIEIFLSELRQAAEEIENDLEPNWENLEELANENWPGERLRADQIGRALENITDNEIGLLISEFPEGLHTKLDAIFSKFYEDLEDINKDFNFNVVDVTPDLAVEYLELFQERRRLPNKKGQQRTTKKFKIQELTELTTARARTTRINDIIKALLIHDLNDAGTALTVDLVRDLQRKFIAPGVIQERVIEVLYQVYRKQMTPNNAKNILGVDIGQALDNANIPEGADYSSFERRITKFLEEAEGIKIQDQAAYNFRNMVGTHDAGMPPIFKDFITNIIKGEYETEMQHAFGKKMYEDFLQEAREKSDEGTAYTREGTIYTRQGQPIQIWKFPGREAYAKIGNKILNELEILPLDEYDANRFSTLRRQYTIFKRNEKYEHRLTDNIIGDLLGADDKQLSDHWPDAFKKAITNLFLDVRDEAQDLGHLNDPDLSGGKGISYLIKVIRLAEIEVLGTHTIQAKFEELEDTLKGASDEQVLQLVSGFDKLFGKIQIEIRAKILKLVDNKLNHIVNNLRLYTKANNRIIDYLIENQFVIPSRGV